MTDGPAFPHDDAVDGWIDRQRAALVADLRQALDVDAGLRELLIPKRHADLVGDLADLLDVDAGLTAIVPGTTESYSPPQVDEQEAGFSRPLRDLARWIRALDHRSRLWIRRRTELEMLDLALDIAAVRTAVQELHRRFDPIRAIDLIHMVDDAYSLAVDLQAFEIANHLRTTRQLTRDVDESTIRDLVEDVDGLWRRGRTAASSLRGRRKENDHPILNQALALAFTDALVASDPIGVEELTSARDDFAGADLRRLTLKDLSLRGVIWSTATRWPTGFEKQVRRDSMEIAPGLFVVRGDGNRRRRGVLA